MKRKQQDDIAPRPKKPFLGGLFRTFVETVYQRESEAKLNADMASFEPMKVLHFANGFTRFVTEYYGKLILAEYCEFLRKQAWFMAAQKHNLFGVEPFSTSLDTLVNSIEFLCFEPGNLRVRFGDITMEAHYTKDRPFYLEFTSESKGELIAMLSEPKHNGDLVPFRVGSLFAVRTHLELTRIPMCVFATVVLGCVQYCSIHHTDTNEAVAFDNTTFFTKQVRPFILGENKEPSVAYIAHGRYHPRVYPSNTEVLPDWHGNFYLPVTVEAPLLLAPLFRQDEECERTCLVRFAIQAQMHAKSVLCDAGAKKDKLVKFMEQCVVTVPKGEETKNYYEVKEGLHLHVNHMIRCTWTIGELRIALRFGTVVNVPGDKSVWELDVWWNNARVWSLRRSISSEPTESKVVESVSHAKFQCSAERLAQIQNKMGIVTGQQLVTIVFAIVTRNPLVTQHTKQATVVNLISEFLSFEPQTVGHLRLTQKSH